MNTDPLQSAENKQKKEEEGLFSCFLFSPVAFVHFYLQCSEAEAVEQRQSDHTAQDAVDRRDEARSS